MKEKRTVSPPRVSRESFSEEKVIKKFARVSMINKIIFVSLKNL